MNPLRDNPFNAPLAIGVQRVGFRKWYERELLSSHAHMALAVLAVLAMIASFEALRGGSANERALDTIFILLSAGVGYWALRRYLFLLMRAEVLANQANCGDCGTYARFKVIGQAQGGREARVCCLKCEHVWTISA